MGALKATINRRVLFVLFFLSLTGINLSAMPDAGAVNASSGNFEISNSHTWTPLRFSFLPEKFIFPNRENIRGLDIGSIKRKNASRWFA